MLVSYYTRFHIYVALHVFIVLADMGCYEYGPLNEFVVVVR